MEKNKKESLFKVGDMVALARYASVGKIIVAKLLSVDECGVETCGAERRAIVYCQVEAGPWGVNRVYNARDLIHLNDARKIAAQYIRQKADEVEGGRHDIKFDDWANPQHQLYSGYYLI